MTTISVSRAVTLASVPSWARAATTERRCAVQEHDPDIAKTYALVAQPSRICPAAPFRNRRDQRFCRRRAALVLNLLRLRCAPKYGVCCYGRAWTGRRFELARGRRVSRRHAGGQL